MSRETQRRMRRVQPERAGLLSDSQGATMVMGVFIATLLVGMVYYVWGIGDVIVHRERMQDAADTASFGAAVIHARGMNMLALLNMIMASLAVVAATYATIASMITNAAVIAATICAGCGWSCGSCCSACPWAVRHGIEAADARSRSNSMDNTIEGLVRGLNGYAMGIRVGVPIAAQAKVLAYGTGTYSPTTEVGAMAPIRAELPAEDDPTHWPCDEKVTPWVQLFSGPGALVSGTSSWYLAGGIGLSYLMNDPRRHSRRWCRDEYFQRVAPGTEMGGTDFQVQAYMTGDTRLEWSQRGVGVATWGHGRDEGMNYTRMAEIGRLSFAQAEFFFDADEADDREWLWHMMWRARLRRWRPDVLGGAGGLGSACVACGGLGEVVGDGSLVVH